MKEWQSGLLKLLTKGSSPYEFTGLLLSISGRSMEFHLGKNPVHPVPSFLDAIKHGVTLGLVCSSMFLLLRTKATFQSQGYFCAPGKHHNRLAAWVYFLKETCLCQICG